jgi:hypothetical protein
MNVDNIHEAISLLRMEVRNFKPSRNGKTWNWSCEVCGDSADGRKARFGVTVKAGSAVCNCFNCSYANNFFSYLRSYHPSIYERLAINDIKEQASSEYDVNHLFEQNINDSDLIALFYGDNNDSMDVWVSTLKSKKITISKNNFAKLYKLRKQRYTL